MEHNDFEKRIDIISNLTDSKEVIKNKWKELKKKHGKQLQKRIIKVRDTVHNNKSLLIRQVRNNKLSDLLDIMEKDIKNKKTDKIAYWSSIAGLIKPIINFANKNSIDLNKIFQYTLREALVYLEGFSTAKGIMNPILINLKEQITELEDRGRTYSTRMMNKINALELEAKQKGSITKGSDNALKHLVYKAAIETKTFVKEGLIDEKGNYKELVYNIMDAYRKQRKKIVL